MRARLPKLPRIALSLLASDAARPAAAGTSRGGTVIPSFNSLPSTYAGRYTPPTHVGGGVDSRDAPPAGLFPAGVRPPATPGPGGPAGIDYAGLLRAAGTDAQSVYDPILAAISKRYQDYGTSAANNINQLTSTYAGLVGGYGKAVPQIFGEAETKSAALAQALADRLTGEGATQGQDLASTLAAAHQDVPGDINLAGEGAGAANAGFAIDTAEIQRLVAAEAAARNYAAQLPGIAGLTGLNANRDVQAQLASDLADELRSTSAQIPGYAQQLYQTRVGDAQQDRSYQEGVREYNQGRADTLANNKRAATSDRLATLRNLKSDNEASTGYQWTITRNGVVPRKDKNGNPVPTLTREAAVASNLVAEKKASAPAKPIVVGSDKAGRYLVDPVTGRTIGRVTKPVAAGAPKPTQPKTFKGTDGRTYRWDPATNQATLIAGQSGPKPGSPGSAPGSAPRIVRGEWQTASGKAITNPTVVAYWNGLYDEGYTDGKGKMKKPVPPGWKPGQKKSGGSSSSSTRPPGLHPG